PRAQQLLGLRQPADTEIILLPVPSAAGGGGGNCPRGSPAAATQRIQARLLPPLRGPVARAPRVQLARGKGWPNEGPPSPPGATPTSADPTAPSPWTRSARSGACIWSRSSTDSIPRPRSPGG